LKSAITYHIKSALNSYAILFFSQNKVLGALLLLVSFSNVSAGLTGLFCVLFSLLIVNLMGFQRDFSHMGLYSFNALIFGLAFGVFYRVNSAFVWWLLIACLITVVLSIILSAWFAKYHLPILSIPFLLTYWIVILAAGEYNGIGLLAKDPQLLSQLSEPGHYYIFNSSCCITGFQLPYHIDLFFRSISAILFQNNVIAGIVIAIGIFIHSRISFSLLVIGFISVCLFHRFSGIYPDSFSYYNLGVNFMMVCVAVGSFFLIPSWRSYLFAIISIPASFLLVNALSKLLGIYNLPAFSLPFCLITISLLYFFSLRALPGKLQLTPLQRYSPEKNLYQYLNNTKRLSHLTYVGFNLPFMGAWTVSQGYNGDITHKGEWAQALDFVIEDEEQKTFDYTGTLPEHFYCYNKPVLACADGIVHNVVDNIDDNEIGKTNIVQNWGNTVVIKHADHLYSKVSHLKKNSVKVKHGDLVKRGDLLGLCGNSGRSPEPHLHFQVQLTPYIGSKTFAYPFANYVGYNTAGQSKYYSYSIPEERMVVKPADINPSLQQAFAFEPGYYSLIKTTDGKQETWEVFKDDFGNQYLYCKETKAVAYFVNDGSVFYFTDYYGSETSLLYYFYLAAYKVNFNADYPGISSDTYPLESANRVNLWLHDLVAPFYQFVKYTYGNICKINQEEVMINAYKDHCLFNRRKRVMDAYIQVAGNKLKTLKVKRNNKLIEAEWSTGNMF